MRSLLKQNWPIVLALVITTITQIAYWVAKSELGNCYDCGEYQDLANFISRDPKNIISDLRPPLYPIFLIAVGLASPSIQGDFNLYLFQSVFLVLSLIVFWRLIKTSGLPQFLSWIPILLLAISPAFYSFTKFKMTETINMFLLLTLITLALKLKERLSLKDIFVFCVVSVIATFLRFANSYLAFVMLLGIFVYYRKNLKYDQNLIKLGLAVVLIVIPQVLYSFANLHRNYYYGLTGETGTNLLGKLVQYQLIPKKDPQFQEIINAVSGCTGPLASSDVYTCVWNFLPKNSFVSKYSATNQYVDAFTKKYIVLNLPTYILKSIPVAF